MPESAPPAEPTNPPALAARCLHDGHLIHPKGRYGTYASGQDAELCTATNVWGQ